MQKLEVTFMDFEITNRDKKLARKNRKKYEAKWRGMRIASRIILAILIFSIIYGYIIIDYSNSSEDAIVFVGIMISLSFVCYVAIKSLLSNFTSHLIQTRLNEKMYIEDNKIHHIVQTSFAVGVNYRNADQTAYEFIIDINTINNARYNSKSKRIEFNASGKCLYYSNLYNNEIDKEWDLSDANLAYYDYYKPSLFDTLTNKGIEFKETEFSFSIRDARI